MLELEEALGRILATVPPVQVEDLPLAEAQGRVLAEPIHSTTDLPPFANSAMDGYAARAQDTRGATQQNPRPLKLVGRVAAGEVFKPELEPGDCLRLFTGSPMPAGADCVVMQEDALVDPQNPGQVLILEPADAGENVRPRGEDVQAGACLAQPGQILSAGHLCLLSAAGINRVKVGRQPTVALIATGSELREPGEPLGPGQIYESNRVGLAALIRGAGAKPAIFPIVPDTTAATRQTLTEAFAGSDLVVSAGGASVGELDLIKPAFQELGGAFEFWKVAIKPGRPFAFGRWCGKLFFGLPGNPVSALVTFLVLARPALRRWQGAAEVQLAALPGTLAEPLSNPGARRHFMRVRRNPDGLVSLAGAQASHLLRAFAQGTGLVDVPANTSLPRGASVLVRVWDP